MWLCLWHPMYVFTFVQSRVLSIIIHFIRCNVFSFSFSLKVFLPSFMLYDLSNTENTVGAVMHTYNPSYSVGWRRTTILRIAWETYEAFLKNKAKNSECGSVVKHLLAWDLMFHLWHKNCKMPKLLNCNSLNFSFVNCRKLDSLLRMAYYSNNTLKSSLKKQYSKHLLSFL